MNTTTDVKTLYHQFYGCARMYWRDMQYSGLDAIEKSKRKAYEVAAQRVGFPLSLCDRLFATCFDERLVPNGRIYDMATHISGWAEANKVEERKLAMLGRPFFLIDPLFEGAAA